MKSNRLEAFSDGVLAIVITIMVLEFKAPHEATWEALRPLLPVALSYVLSFIYVGIYWNNHHHLLHSTERVTGPVLWANNLLLFWLSLVPFVTGWMGETGFAHVPVTVYGGVLLMAAVSYFILVQAIIKSQKECSLLARAIGDDWKGKASLAAYVIGILLTPVSGWLSLAIYAGVALIWLVPDKRIEKMIEEVEG